MIIVLAGTTEGREVIALLKPLERLLTATVVSSYGAELLESDGLCDTKQGTLDKNKLIKLIQDKDARFLVDATHPFATQISSLAMEVSAEQDINYIRLERKNSILHDYPLVHRIEKIEQIEEYLYPGQVVFNTMGSKKLSIIVPLVEKHGANLITRVLPSANVIKNCEELGLNCDHIIAAKGPFSKELNKQMFKHYGAQLILSKDSGTNGGVEAKLEAALELSIPVLVWSRPELTYPQVVYSPEEVVEYIKAKLENIQIKL